MLLILSAIMALSLAELTMMVWLQIVWQGPNVTLCKVNSSWFSKPHPATWWTSYACYACMLHKEGRCQSYLTKHIRKGLEVRNDQIVKLQTDALSTVITWCSQVQN